MRAVSKEPVRLFSGKIIGYIETDAKGNQMARDFYGRIISKGNQVAGMIWNPQYNSLAKNQ